MQEVRVCDASDLWMHVRHRAGVTRMDYNKYFVGSKRPVGVGLTNPARLGIPVSLADLRKDGPTFQPLQSFRCFDKN